MSQKNMKMNTKSIYLSNLWTKEEHDLFIQALELYGMKETGQEWKDITKYIQTKSIEEVRLYGKRYLHQLLQKYPSNTFFHTKILPSLQTRTKACTNEEIKSSFVPMKREQITALQYNYRPTKRMKIGQKEEIMGSGDTLYSTSFPWTQPSKCYDKNIKRYGRQPKLWTYEEDLMFETALANASNKMKRTKASYAWSKIAVLLPGKTSKDVRSRYEKLVRDVTAIIETNSSFEAWKLCTLQLSTDTISYGNEDESKRKDYGNEIKPLALASPDPLEWKKFQALSVDCTKSTTENHHIGLLSPTFFDYLSPNIKRMTENKEMSSLSVDKEEILPSSHPQESQDIEKLNDTSMNGTTVPRNAISEDNRSSTQQNPSTGLWQDFLEEQYDSSVDPKCRILSPTLPTKQEH